MDEIWLLLGGWGAFRGELCVVWVMWADKHVYRCWSEILVILMRVFMHAYVDNAINVLC